MSLGYEKVVYLLNRLLQFSEILPSSPLGFWFSCFVHFLPLAYNVWIINAMETMWGFRNLKILILLWIENCTIVWPEPHLWRKFHFFCWKEGVYVKCAKRIRKENIYAKKKTLNQQFEALVCDSSSYHSWVFWPYDLIYTALASSVKPVPVFHSSQYFHGIQMRSINKMVRQNCKI